MSSILASSLRAASRRTLTQSARAYNTTARRANTSSTASQSTISSSIRSGIERASAEAHDEAFKSGVVYTLLGVSALGAGYLVLAPKEGKTVVSHDLL